MDWNKYDSIPLPAVRLRRPIVPAGPRKTRRHKPPAVRDRDLLILDIETQPFKEGRKPAPFAVGIYGRSPHEGGTPGRDSFALFWGPDCIARSVVHIRTLKNPSIIYAHNGGGFDYKGYYTPYLDGTIRIINGRIVQAFIGNQELRDSYAIMPFALKDYSKDDIDYSWFETARLQNKHRAAIVDYLRSDCQYLSELVETFHAEFGPKKLTIGSTAMTEIQKLHTFASVNISFDREIRPKFFSGGRNQCFRSGIIHGPVSVHDVNSMYPYVMANFEHPTGDDFSIGSALSPSTFFLDVTGRNRGALATRGPHGGIDFTREFGEFSTTIHEYRAALDTGTFEPYKILRTYDFDTTGTFDAFVNHFYSARARAKKDGDKARVLLYKFVLNSGYGKFAQNPHNYFDWKISRETPPDPCRHCKGSGYCRDCFRCEAINDYQPHGETCMYCHGSGHKWMLEEFDDSSFKLWKAHTPAHLYYNVATGASITGAARSLLLRGIAASVNPLYCDTDSIISSRFTGPVSDSDLGAWKLETSATVCAIAGKKLYALFTPEPPALSPEDARRYPYMLEPVYWKGRELYCVKKAHKGVRATPLEILRVAGGGSVEIPNPVPCFRLDGSVKPFQSRIIRKTA
jgi:DNA polymerase type B, organellar and viral